MSKPKFKPVKPKYLIQKINDRLVIMPFQNFSSSFRRVRAKRRKNA